MSDDSDDDSSKRRDKFTSERTDRKRVHEEEEQHGRPRGRSSQSHYDTPRPRRNRYDSQGFPKRSRYDNRGGMGMPDPRMFRPPIGGMPPGAGGRFRGPPPQFMGPGMMGPPVGGQPSPAAQAKPKVERKILQYDVMGLDEWKSTKGKNVEEANASSEFIKFKVKSVRRQVHAIFQAYKEQLWFKEQYDPDCYDAHKRKLQTAATERLAVFSSYLSEEKFETVSWKAEYRKQLQLLLKELSESLNASTVAVEGDTNGAKEGEDGDVNDDENNSDKKRLSLSPSKTQGKAFSVELLNALDTLEDDAAAAFSQVPGFRQISIARSHEASPFNNKGPMRRIWATFSGVQVASVLKELESVKIKDTAIVFQLAPRIMDQLRCPLDCVLVESDKELAEKIISSLDSRISLYPSSSGVESNPLLATKNPSLEKMVMYLRVVHSYDFFSGTYLDHEHGLAQRIGRLTIPNVGVFMGTSKDEWRDIGWGIADSADEFKDFEHGGELTEETVIDDLADRNTEKIGDEIYLCPLSGKKFKAPKFVRKHILTKHEELVKRTQKDLPCFNNYIRDIFRIRELPLGGPGGHRPPLFSGPSPQQRDPNKDEFGRDVPLHRRQRHPAPLSQPPIEVTRSRPTYGDLF